MDITIEHIWPISGILLGFQAYAIGWRIQKEVEAKNQHSRTWFPVADHLNLASMFCMVIGVFIAPVLGYGTEQTIQIWFCISIFLLLSYSVALPAHYELFNRKTKGSGKYCPKQEKKALSIIALSFLVFMCFLIKHIL